MKRILWLTLGLVAFFCLPAAAEMEVVESVITTSVVDRMPVDSVETFPANVGKLYCFTHVVGAEDDTSITHVWYLGNTEMARITLPVRSSSWRTWSSKNFLPEWTGDWRVDVLDGQGDLLNTISFTLN